MQKDERKKVLVWDYPIRIFHLLFAFSVSAALILGLTSDEHSPLFAWHIYFGVVAGFLLILRIVYGLFSSGPASLTELLLSPLKVAGYLKQLVSGKPAPEAKHNPLASLTYLVMFCLLGLVLLTGFNMRNEFAEESHEALALALLATILLHLAGIAFHSFYHKENVALSMATGRKIAPESQAIPSGRPIIGIAVLALSALFIVQLGQNFEPRSSSLTIPWINAKVCTGECEGGCGEGGGCGDHHEKRSEREHGCHDDDDDD